MVALVWSVLEVGLYFALYPFARDSRLQQVQRNANRITDMAKGRDALGERILDRLRVTENSMILMGALFVPTAFVLLAAAAMPPIPNPNPVLRTVLAIVSPALYSWWLFSIQLSTRVMHDVDNEILITAEGNGGLTNLFRDLYGAGQGQGLMMFVRRNHWIAYLLLLIFGSVSVVSQL